MPEEERETTINFLPLSEYLARQGDASYDPPTWLEVLTRQLEEGRVAMAELALLKECYARPSHLDEARDIIRRLMAPSTLSVVEYGALLDRAKNFLKETG